MKSPKEIFGRAVVVALVAERALLEAEGGDGCETIEEQIDLWGFINDWLKETDYTIYMTEDDKRFMDAPVREAGLNWAGPKSFLAECISPLLWSIGLLDNVAPYTQSDYTSYGAILMQCHPDHDMNAILSKCKMRSKEEIEDQCKTAFLWHWRAVESRLNKGWRGDLRKVIENSLGEGYLKYLCAPAFWISEGRKNVDMVFEGHVIYELSGRMRYHFEMCAEMRHKALEWVLGDEDWDDTPTDT